MCALPARRKQTDQPFAQALPGLLKERNLTVNALAKGIGKSQSHLSRALRGADSKAISIAIIQSVREHLGLPVGFFPEKREALVIEHIQRNPDLRERLYKRLLSRAKSE